VPLHFEEEEEERQQTPVAAIATRAPLLGSSDRAWASSAGVRSTGTRTPMLGSPRAPGEARG